MAAGDAHCVSWLSHTSTCTNTTFLSKATDHFSHMLLLSVQTNLKLCLLAKNLKENLTVKKFSYNSVVNTPVPMVHFIT